MEYYFFKVKMALLQNVVEDMIKATLTLNKRLLDNLDSIHLILLNYLNFKLVNLYESIIIFVFLLS
jgi:hypothetical protein